MYSKPVYVLGTQLHHAYSRRELKVIIYRRNAVVFHRQRCEVVAGKKTKPVAYTTAQQHGFRACKKCLP